MKPLLDDVKWDDLFERVEWGYDTNAKKWDFLPHDPGLSHEEDNRISEYLQIHGEDGHYTSAHVRPTERVVELLREQMLTECGPLYFELILLGDVARVFCKYNSILGSRLLAELPTLGLPVESLPLSERRDEP